MQRERRDHEEQERQLQEWHNRLGAEADRLAQLAAEQEVRAAHLEQRGKHLDQQQAQLGALQARLEQRSQELERADQELMVRRGRIADAEADLKLQIQEAQRLREMLEQARKSQEDQERRLAEQTAALAARAAEVEAAQRELADGMQALAQRTKALDARAADQEREAESLKQRLGALLDGQERLAAERQQLRERETSLAQAEQTRAALQEQLRRRGDDLAERQKTLAEQARSLEARAAEMATRQAELERQCRTRLEDLDARSAALDHRAADLERLRVELEQREAAVQAEFTRRAADLRAEITSREDGLHQRLERFREAARRFGQARKRLAAERMDQAARQARREAELAASRADLASIHQEVAALHRFLPEWELRAGVVADRLAAARDQLQQHLQELHAFARQSREELEQHRQEIQRDAERLQERRLALDRDRDQHRLALAAFRQQIIAWQGQVADLKRSLAHDEGRLELRQAEVAEAARVVDATSSRLARQAEELQEQERAVAEQREDVARHLDDLRRWYRKKLRELAATSHGAGAAGSWTVVRDDADADEPRQSAPRILDVTAEVEPGDRQLGELLRSLDLIDADTLTTLLVEARRQRRSLRQVLLASEQVTLYQLALIEAGNLDGLMLGRFRVVDRVPGTEHETHYRVVDPRGKTAVQALLRHLAAETASVPDRAADYRERFSRAAALVHPNVARTFEVLEIAGRPAVLQEWIEGLPGTEWLDLAAVPGVWYRLLHQTALGLQTAHEAGLVHGRLEAGHLILTADGLVKVRGFGEPSWLHDKPHEEDAPSVAPSPLDDLAALGVIASSWITPAVRGKAAKSRSPLKPLLELVDALNADAPRFASAAELLDALERVGADLPPNAEAWDRLRRLVIEQAAQGLTGLRQSA
jgi:chromosome segregation ATPase